jgi:hypothetical protein
VADLVGLAQPEKNNNAMKTEPSEAKKDGADSTAAHEPSCVETFAPFAPEAPQEGASEPAVDVDFEGEGCAR